MAQQSILRMGDPRLLRVARAVQDDDWPSIEPLLADMHDTMIAAGGTGLAAPQIGVDLRVIVFEVAGERNDDHSVPVTVLINPEIEIVDPTLQAGLEGCLSVPGMRGVVDRYTSIRYRALDQHQRPIARDASGFHARVVQHEADHLDGILYPMRMQSLERFGFNDEILQMLES